MFEPYSYGMNPYQQQNPYYQQRYPMMPQSQPQQAPQQQASISTNKIYATGIDDVRGRQLPTNSDYLFLDNDKPLIYRKIVDGTGKMEVQVFKIVPYEDKPKEAPQVDLSQYVLKSDFDSLRKEVDNLRSLKQPKQS